MTKVQQKRQAYADSKKKARKPEEKNEEPQKGRYLDREARSTEEK